MSTRARQYDAQVLRREQLSPHLVRLTLGGAGLADFRTTGVPDEWVGLVVPGQFQSRYYTVRRWAGGELVLVEQRPRAQSRATTFALPQGHGVVVTTEHRPLRTARGWSRAPVRHGVSVVRSGRRRTLGLLFHDAA